MKKMNFLQVAVFGIGALCLTAPYSLQAQQRIGFLEFPNNGSYLFGIETIRGWVCNAKQITVAIDGGQPFVVAYGGERADTIAVCGDMDNGFAWSYNWASLSPGKHSVCAYSDSTEIGCATVTVLTLGQEFIGPSDQKGILINIPERRTILLMQWDPARQRPVVVDVKKVGMNRR
jgi:hypothetical protein